jgi:hypothetical protein
MPQGANKLSDDVSAILQSEFPVRMMMKHKRILLLAFYAVVSMIVLVAVPLLDSSSIAQILDRTASFNFQDTPLTAAIDNLRVEHNLPIVLESGSSKTESSLFMCGPDIPLRDIASFISSCFDLHAVVSKRGVVITSDPTRMHQVGYYEKKQTYDPSVWTRILGYWH